jgi:predicted nucleic acid-binding protein
MMTIVSDTSPINYLILIEQIELLPQLFERVMIPPAVWKELQHPKTPKPVYDWAANLPVWASVHAPSRMDDSLSLDPGETEAISLAVELNIKSILVDDRHAWFAAKDRAIVPIGTVTVLELADIKGLVDFQQAMTNLRSTNFHIQQRTFDEAIERHRVRRTSSGH